MSHKLVSLEQWPFHQRFVRPILDTRAEIALQVTLQVGMEDPLRKVHRVLICFGKTACSRSRGVQNRVVLCGQHIKDA